MINGINSILMYILISCSSECEAADQELLVIAREEDNSKSYYDNHRNDVISVCNRFFIKKIGYILSLTFMVMVSSGFPDLVNVASLLL